MTAIFESPAETLGEHIDRLAGIEAQAESVQAWQPMLIPGLLQCYTYACASIRAASPAVPLEVVADRADARRQRIDRLGKPGARQITVIVDEAALHRPVGGHQALADQLEHLLAVEALQPSLSIRVLPQGGQEHPGLLGAFTLYRAGGQRAVFTESLTDSTISTRPEDVAAYAAAWERLTALTLSPQESVQLIDGVRGNLCRRG
ncbi:DUF5753 domain-containing protein [Streptomyces sp. NPDC057596]|uniref:DUF5753 domain-containing protein n=1 Tax=Streptomyces sp. NPDC057596 TaxID=3346178 RepID=UPI00367411D4